MGYTVCLNSKAVVLLLNDFLTRMVLPKSYLFFCVGSTRVQALRVCRDLLKNRAAFFFLFMVEKLGSWLVIYIFNLGGLCIWGPSMTHSPDSANFALELILSIIRASPQTLWISPYVHLHGSHGDHTCFL